MDFNMDEQAAASAVAFLNAGSKRDRDDDSPDAAGGGRFKRGRTEEAPEAAAVAPPAAVAEVADAAPVVADAAPVVANPAAAAPAPPQDNLKPYPFFRYRDFSTSPDSDPLSPLTPPGRVPNFPAKMHSILSRPELSDIISWLPHGRAWRILKPREFEVRVIPTYFEHTKFSSFIRQANGWGFRRVTQGRDRNAYYHELFLRGLPHLCKEMKRPGVSKKQAVDPDHEPDFYKISEMHLVPEKAKDDSILLQCTIQGGPKARMPIYSGALSSSSSSYRSTSTVRPLPMTSMVGATAPSLTPADHKNLTSFQQALGTFESQLQNLQLSTSATPSTASPAAPSPAALPPSTFALPGQTPTFPSHRMPSPLAAANQLAFSTSGAPGAAMNPMAAAFQATTAASQFAAGFAAAAALSQQQFKNMMDSFAAANMPPTKAPAAGAPAVTPAQAPSPPSNS